MRPSTIYKRYIYVLTTPLYTPKVALPINFTGPGLDAVEYETVTFRGAQDDENPYKGHPSPDIDAAWRKLTEGKG